ncbi:unnamed protein product [Chrysoparadoxa australica]
MDDLKASALVGEKGEVPPGLGLETGLDMLLKPEEPLPAGPATAESEDEWKVMQKQFEIMNKEFQSLQKEGLLDPEGDMGPQSLDPEGIQAFEMLRDLNIDEPEQPALPNPPQGQPGGAFTHPPMGSPQMPRGVQISTHPQQGMPRPHMPPPGLGRGFPQHQAPQHPQHQQFLPQQQMPPRHMMHPPPFNQQQVPPHMMHHARGPGPMAGQGGFPMNNGPPVRPPQADVRGFPCGDMMTQYDVRFVATAQMRALETSDPYKDDFYFHNFVRKKAERTRQEQHQKAFGDGQSHPPPPSLPPLALPVWHETKAIHRKEETEKRESNEKRSKEWESEHKVLGHTARADVTKPRALLKIPSASQAGEETSQEGAAPSSTGATFDGQLWLARTAIEQAGAALLDLDELRHMLDLPLPPPRRMELLEEQGKVLWQLAKSVGIRGTDGQAPATEVEIESGLDLQVLSTVLELGKGQKALARALGKLQHRQCWGLIPAVLALTLARPPPSTGKGTDRQQADALAAEGKLMKAVKEMVENSHAPPSAHTLERCLVLVMAAHAGRGSLGGALLERSRAEAMHAVLQVGTKVCRGEAEARWAQLQAEFMGMVTAGQQGVR